MFNIKTYQKASSVQEAVKLLQENPKARLVAGGTDVLVKLQKGKGHFHHLIDIHDLDALKFINQTESGDLVIGSGTCFTDVEQSPLIRKRVPVLALAISTIGGPQVRNMATIGGNLCNGVPSADSAPALMVLNASLTLEGTDGQRQLPLEDFFQGPGKVALEPTEVLTSITIAHENYASYHGHFYKYAMRDAMDIATIGCAAVCKIEDNVLKDLRLAYNTAAPVPVRCRLTERKVRDRQISQELFDDIATTVSNDVKPRTSWRAAKDFRLQIISTLARRVVRQAILNAGGTIQ